ncbi:hypothetical protein ALC53_10576, partial [Atta colombica]
VQRDETGRPYTRPPVVPESSSSYIVVASYPFARKPSRIRVWYNRDGDNRKFRKVEEAKFAVTGKTRNKRQNRKP